MTQSFNFELKYVYDHIFKEDLLRLKHLDLLVIQNLHVFHVCTVLFCQLPVPKLTFLLSFPSY